MTLMIVIPCLNESKNLPILLEQFLSDPTAELIVVVDGGSSDGSREIVQQICSTNYRVKLIHNAAKIQSAGVNLAVSEFGTDFDWLLRVDAHCLYPDNYAKKLLSSAIKNRADSVVVPMRTIGAGGFQDAVALAQNSVLGTGGAAHRHIGKSHFVDHGHHALIRMRVFREIGGYCEAMPCNEDAEFDYRQTQAGAKIWLETDAAIDYFPRSTPKALWTQYFKYGVGRARTLKRHGMQPHLRQVLPLAIPVAAIGLLFTAIHWVFAVPFLVWLSICLLLGAFLGIRAGGGAKLLAGVAASIMHLAWGSGFVWSYIKWKSEPLPKYGLS